MSTIITQTASGGIPNKQSIMVDTLAEGDIFFKKLFQIHCGH
jgi:hypothetical protein